MSFSSSNAEHLAVCSKCGGEGRISRPPSRKARLRYKRARTGDLPPPRWEPCSTCSSTGLTNTKPPEQAPFNVAIIGGGIGGLALAVACRHRSIPCTVYERDLHFGQRSQGYGLTMQQASKALRSFGIDLQGGITSTKHVVHTPDGAVVGEWGMRKWGESQKNPKRQNVHIARQALRCQLLEEYGGSQSVAWNCRLLKMEARDGRTELTFANSGEGEQVVTAWADVVVGADGIRSTVRDAIVGEVAAPLRYLDCIVILGICPRTEIRSESPLLDGETVFQTADGTTRLYAMPYSRHEYMWQLSFPMSEASATELSRTGSSALKDEAINKCRSWHDPILSLLEATPRDLVSGYPVYDRAILKPEMLQKQAVTLIGDAAHPMSPFKGQGANQALLDALSLARALYKAASSDTIGIRDSIENYEKEMIERTSVKVQASADAARFLHTDVAIQEGNVTRGAAAMNALREDSDNA